MGGSVLFWANFSADGARLAQPFVQKTQVASARTASVMQHGFVRLRWRDHRLVGIVLVMLCLGVTSGCEYRSRTENPVPPDSVLTDRPSQITRDARFSVRESGRRRATIRADKMEQYQTNDSTYSVWRTLSDTTQVQSFIFEEGDSSATITADSVVYFSQDGRFEAYGNVVVRTQEGRVLQSERLTWNQFDRQIRTRRFVQITTPTEVVRGNGLVANEDLSTYQIGKFQAEVETDEE